MSRKKYGFSYRILKSVPDFYLHKSNLAPSQEVAGHFQTLKPVDDGVPENCICCRVHWGNTAMRFRKQSGCTACSTPNGSFHPNQGSLFDKILPHLSLPKELGTYFFINLIQILLPPLAATETHSILVLGGLKWHFFPVLVPPCPSLIELPKVFPKNILLLSL